ncbi:hypothetical protein M434DRAFT_392118 [Hypoxylon sp. CO27-5]|nr:hypothetical protein M434DRAFT_392118 [Hypoxylon sp. CO27-5]
MSDEERETKPFKFVTGEFPPQIPSGICHPFSRILTVLTNFCLIAGKRTLSFLHSDRTDDTRRRIQNAGTNAFALVL